MEGVETNDREAMYGPLVIAYLFLGGTAAGGLFCMSAWSLALGALASRTATPSRSARARRALPPGSRRRGMAFDTLQARVYPLCLAALILAVVFLFWDLGRPDRALLLFTRPHATLLTFGAFCLAAEALVGFLLVLASRTQRLARLQRHGERATRARRVLEATCCLLSLATMAYTGAFLSDSPAIPFWNTPALVAVFVCSSLSCGLSVMLLVDYFVRDQTLLLRAARPLQICHLICLAAETVSIALFVAAAHANPFAADALAALASPELLPTALVGVVGFGIVVPAALETYTLIRKPCRAIPFSDVLCLTGGVCLRLCVIVCGGG